MLLLESESICDSTDLHVQVSSGVPCPLSAAAMQSPIEEVCHLPAPHRCKQGINLENQLTESVWLRLRNCDWKQIWVSLLASSFIDLLKCTYHSICMLWYNLL